MIELITGMGGQVLWLVIGLAGGLVALFGYGWKKKREGREAERARAAKARRKAAERARQTRSEVDREPISDQRKETERWED